MEHHVVKLVMLGDGGVGKSSIVKRKIRGVFVICEYNPTTEDTYRKLITVDREQVMLEIYDTFGLEEFTALRDVYIRDCEGFIIVYSVISPNSFEQVKEIYERIIEVKGLDCDHIPIIIAGNKIDLEKDREVTFEEGRELANKLGVDFMECSARNDIKINELFYRITFDVMVNLPPTKNDTPTPKTRGCLLC
ncbi:uncharacterized protein QTN25_009832 [Entamoeba marina]